LVVVGSVSEVEAEESERVEERQEPEQRAEHHGVVEAAGKDSRRGVATSARPGR
jgi:hypothetical protein